MMTKINRIKDMALGDVRPEKAGVGGSIPSLATIKINNFRMPKTSTTFQNVPIAVESVYSSRSESWPDRRQTLNVCRFRCCWLSFSSEIEYLVWLA